MKEEPDLASSHPPSSKSTFDPASWKNNARSRFAAHPTSAIPSKSYVHWSDDPNHAILLRLPQVIAVAGALPSYSATLFHSHHHDAFVLSVLDTPTLLMQELQPPDYLRRHAHRTLSLTTGASFAQCPFSSKLPLVHRAVTLHHPAAFFMVEASVSPLPSPAPPIVFDEHSSVKAVLLPSTNLGAAVRLCLDPHARASVTARPSSSPLPLSRFICRTQSSLDVLYLKLPTHLLRQTANTVVGGQYMQVIAITGFKESTDTWLEIHNPTRTAWFGIIVDIFGTAPL